MPGKRYYLYVLLLLLSIPSYSNAQWEQVLDKTVYCFYTKDSTLFAGTNASGLLTTTNNGNNWNTIFLGASIWDMELVGDDIFAAWANRVSKSTNGGQNWTHVFLPHFVRSLIRDGSIFFAGIQDSGVYKSTDYGSSWAQTSLKNKSVLSLENNDGRLFAGTRDSGIYYSTDNGLNWTQSGLNGKTISCISKRGNELFVGTDLYGVYWSTNNGNSWIQTSFDSTTVLSIVTSGNNIFAGAFGPIQGVYKSVNNGQSWMNITDGMILPSIVSLHISGGYLFTSTGNGKTHRRPLSQVTVINPINNESPGKYLLHQNYPNPFNPSTRISFQIQKTGNVKLVIYDHLGREVTTILNENLSPGTYEMKFDGSNLSSGIYYYKLITGEFTETKKMVLVK